MSVTVNTSHIIDVVLDVRGICRRPPWVGGRGQVMGGIPPEGLFATRKARRRVVGARGGGNVMGIPQQVYVKGILQGDRKRLHVSMSYNINKYIKTIDSQSVSQS